MAKLTKKIIGFESLCVLILKNYKVGKIVISALKYA